MPKKSRRARPRYKPNRDQWVIFHNGQDRYLCAGRANEPLAWERAQRITGQPADGGRRPTTVTAAVDAYLQQRGDTWMEYILSPFMAWAVGTGLNDVHAEYLGDYLLHLEKVGYVRTVQKWEKPGGAKTPKNRKRPVKLRRPYSPSTLRRQICYARAVLSWAHTRGYMTRPVPDMPKLPRVAQVVRSLPQDVLQQIIDALPAQARDVLAFQAMVGARIEEAALLRHEEVSGDIAELRRGKTFKRTGKPRVLYLTPAAKSLIAEQGTSTGYVFLSRLGTPYTTAGLRSIIKRAGQRVGVELTGPYQLRHTWAQIRVDNDAMSLDAVGEALGHEPGSPATKAYAQITRARVLREVQSLADVVSLDRPTSAAPSTVDVNSPHRKADQASQRKSAKGRKGRRAG